MNFFGPFLIFSPIFQAEIRPISSHILFLQIWRLKQAKVKTVALQLPEGLQLFACTLADIIGAYADVEVVPRTFAIRAAKLASKRLLTPFRQVVILGDVTYGACCVDDLNARALVPAPLLPPSRLTRRRYFEGRC